MLRFNKVTRGKAPEELGSFSYEDAHGHLHVTSYALFLVREAWLRGADFENLADGFGEGEGTKGDWSGIRDSSPEAVTAMLQQALNHLFHL